MPKPHFFYLINILCSLSLSIGSYFQCEQDGFYPDKTDCRLYHICVDKIHTVKTCKDELLFNPSKNECDWAMNVNCTSSDEIPRRPSSFDALCETVDNDYIAHPSDCKQYAYCANGVPQAKFCKKNLLWSQTEKMCVWPAQSDCPAKFTTTTTITTTASATSQFAAGLPLRNITQFSGICPPTESKRVPDPYDCTIYHDCYEGRDLISHCLSQYQYHREKQTCDHTDNVRCKNKCTPTNEGGRFVDPSSCCHFYECLAGKFLPQVCPQLTFYDIKLRKCVPANQVKCDERRKCSNKCHYLSGHGVKQNLCESNILCKGRADGFYLDQSKPNCQSYMRCLNQQLVNSSRCPLNQRFNKNLGQCTSSEQVPCFAGKVLSFSFLLVLTCLLLNLTLF